jgi:UDPglucose 6-dehydrogenase
LRRRAVITGGAGFLGSHLVDQLLDRDIDVLCLDNFLTGVPENVVHLRDRRGFDLQNADVTNDVAVAGAVDFVLHFASPASPVDYAELPIQTLKVGAIGTLNGLELAREKGARFLLASTSERFGDPLFQPPSEQYPANIDMVGPRACYDEAKRYAEALTSTYRSKHGVDTAIARIFNTYGPRMRPDDGRAIPTFIRQALQGEAITVAGDGSQTRSMCYVDDLIDGVLRLLFSDLSGPVNLGGPQELSVLEVAELVRNVTGSSSSIKFVARPPGDPSVRRPDIELARVELGWTPTIHVRQGIERNVAWFRQRLAREVDGRIGTTTWMTGAGLRQAQKVAVLGAGYVGAVTAACLAWLGHEVCCVDTNSACADQLNHGQAPFYEPGLQELLRSALATGRLQFTDRFGTALNEANFIFLWDPLVRLIRWILPKVPMGFESRGMANRPQRRDPGYVADQFDHDDHLRASITHLVVRRLPAMVDLSVIRLVVRTWSAAKASASIVVQTGRSRRARGRQRPFGRQRSLIAAYRAEVRTRGKLGQQLHTRVGPLTGDSARVAMARRRRRGGRSRDRPRSA